MGLRIAIWALTGALVVASWTLYLMATVPASHRVLGALFAQVCPIALARHYRMSFYFVLVANAATYALAGVVVEAIRRRFRPTRVPAS